MQLKYVLTICAALLSSTVVAAPVPQNFSEISLDRRAVTPQFTFANDLADIVIPAPAPAGSPAKVVKAQEAKIAAANTKQVAKQKSQQAAQLRVQAVLTAAATPLGLSGALPVKVISDFHTSSDPEQHATFQFTAPICKGTCVGHAYNPVALLSPGKGQPGKIFDAAHNVIFGAADI